jgi:hypothetical protein
MATTTVERAPGEVRSTDSRLRRAGVVCLVAVAVHGVDHLRRGTDVVTTQVLSLGTVQFVLVVLAVALVFRRHPWAAPAAIAVGIPGAVGFAAVHLLPHWGSFSDPFTGSVVAPKVNALSWVTALFEIGADLAFGWAGLRAFTTDGRHDR